MAILNPILKNLLLFEENILLQLKMQLFLLLEKCERVSPQHEYTGSGNCF